MWQLNFVGIFDISRSTKCIKTVLWQSETNVITKSVIIKCDRLLLQSVLGITKCDRLYDNMRQVLQSLEVITKWGVTKVCPSPSETKCISVEKTQETCHKFKLLYYLSGSISFYKTFNFDENLSLHYNAPSILMKPILWKILIFWPEEEPLVDGPW